MNPDRSPHSFLHRLQSVDRDALVAVSTRAIQGGVMAAGAAAVIWRMSPSDQGFYFAFISFGIMLQLCDFGLSYATLQSASHMLATRRSDEIAPLGASALRINIAVTLLAWIFVGALGWLVFARTAAHANTDWVAPWIAFISGVAFNHFTAPSIFLVEGGVSVSIAWRFRMRQEIASGLMLILVLAFGFGLWALAAYFWTRFALALLWMSSGIMPKKKAGSTEFSIADWRRDVWPFQWRVGLSAISGYMVFQAFSPIFFWLQGPAAAGRFALSLAVMNALVMVTTAWPISQAAHFGGMLGRNEKRALSSRLVRLLANSTAFSAVGAIAAIAALLVLERFDSRVAARFADFGTTGLLIATAVVHHVVTCFAVVLRSERRDPLLLLSVAGGFVTVACMTIAAALTNVRGVALVYFFCTGLGLPIAYAIYRKFARRHGFSARARAVN